MRTVKKLLIPLLLTAMVFIAFLPNKGIGETEAFMLAAVAIMFYLVLQLA